MKKTILSLMLLCMAAAISAQTIVKGDMNGDGQVTVADVTAVANVAVGRTQMEYISASSSPFAVDNSYVVGTWYASDGTHFTLGDDGTTDYPGGATYKFYTGQNRLLILNSSERAVQVIPIVEANTSYLLAVDYVTGALTYYTKSTSLVTTLAMSETSLAMNSGTTAQLSVTVTPSDAFNPSVTWTSSDESVVTVDQNGLVTAVAGGTATITATTTDGGYKTAQCTVTVTQMVTSIVLSQTAIVLELDEFVRLTATVLPENAANKSVAWSSSNSDIAPVRNGRVDAYDYGTAVITCEAADGSGVKATCVVSIVDPSTYVDLGLPSGTLWATMNIGAENPEDYGDYFAWGETEGYNDGKTTFNWSTYTLCNGSSTTLTKYCTDRNYGTVDTKTELDLEDDAAYVNWGPNWRMPSYAQQDELINSSYTTMVWTTMNGVNGRKITSRTNGNSIFLPAAGCLDDTSRYYEGSGGYYWLRTLNASYPYYARFLALDSIDVSTSFGNRNSGRSIRPVRNQ